MRWIGVSGLCVVLGGCVSPPAQPPGVTEEYAMDVRSVTIPAGVAASEPMDIDVEVTVGGCSRFERFTATRTPARVTVTATGTRTLNVPCAAIIGWEHRTYTDPGTPARVGPFEVVVNGKVWGTVEVR